MDMVCLQKKTCIFLITSPCQSQLWRTEQLRGPCTRSEAFPPAGHACFTRWLSLCVHCYLLPASCKHRRGHLPGSRSLQRPTLTSQQLLFPSRWSSLSELICTLHLTAVIAALSSRSASAAACTFRWKSRLWREELAVDVPQFMWSLLGHFSPHGISIHSFFPGASKVKLQREVKA